MKRATFYLLGLFIIALGASGVIISDIGAGAWDAVNVGLSQQLGLTTGNWLIIVGALILIFVALLTKKPMDFTAFLTSFLLGFMVDFWMLLIFDSLVVENLQLNILLFGAGFIVMCFGAGTYLQANFAPTPIDSLMLAVSQKFNLPLGRARLYCEIFAVLLGLAVSGPVSVGTLIIAIFIGYGVQATVKIMGKLYHWDMGKKLSTAKKPQ